MANASHVVILSFPKQPCGNPNQSKDYKHHHNKDFLGWICMDLHGF